VSVSADGRPTRGDGLREPHGLREPQRLSQQLSTLLAAEIVSGRVGVGEAFPSSEEIVSTYGVSRTVARETVQALAMLGMVLIQHGKRTEVCPPEDWDILSATVQEALRREGKAEPLLRDLYEFRLLIEPQAAVWMAEHGSDRDLAELGRLVDAMESHIVAAVSVTEVMKADRSFHDLVARAGDNRVLAAVSRDIREVIGTLWGFSNLDERDAEQVAGQHRRIADAVQARDGKAAAGAMRDHLLWAARADLHGLGEPAELRVPTATAALE
jgi:DNA-binding FadR family transcriptional regulator